MSSGISTGAAFPDWKDSLHFALVIGFFFTLFLMTVISIPLHIIYRVTGKKGRVCPACGVNVPVGLTVCPKCLFDFRKIAGGLDY